MEKWETIRIDPTKPTNKIDDLTMDYVKACIENERKTNHDVAGIVQFLRDMYSEMKIGPEHFRVFSQSFFKKILSSGVII